MNIIIAFLPSAPQSVDLKWLTNCCAEQRLDDMKINSRAQWLCLSHISSSTAASYRLVTHIFPYWTCNNNRIPPLIVRLLKSGWEEPFAVLVRICIAFFKWSPSKLSSLTIIRGGNWLLLLVEQKNSLLLLVLRKCVVNISIFAWRKNWKICSGDISVLVAGHCRAFCWTSRKNNKLHSKRTVGHC